MRGRVMPAYKDKWRVTLEIHTFDGDPKSWDWRVFFPDDTVQITESTCIGRILEGEGEGDE
jgi:hypothetical protein